MAEDRKLGPGEVDDDTFKNAVFEDGGNLVINLENVEEMKFELIPRGIYNGTIDELTFGPSKSSGANMFTFVLTIVGGDYEGRKLYFYASFSQKAIKGTKSNLMRINPEIFAGEFKPQQVVESGVLIGTDVKFRVVHQTREDTGEPQHSVGGIMPQDAAVTTGTGDAKGDGAFFK